MRYLFWLGLFSTFGFASAPAAPKPARPLRVLTYSSMMGPHSLGEALEKRFRESCSGCAVEFQEAGGLTSLLGRLRVERRRGAAPGFDVVLGLDETAYQAALHEGLVVEGKNFEWSPYALMVDTQKLPPERWPDSWTKLDKVLAKSVIIEDPRTSTTGLGWIRTVSEAKVQSAGQARKLVSRTFPSWSSAYESFTKGRATAVWSFVTSEAYHRCEEKSTRYRALPLKEGYPVHREWVAPVDGAVESQRDAAKSFVALVLSKEIQQKIPTLNWMLPADASVELPACFRDLPKLKTWEASADAGLRMNAWIEEWMR